MVIIFLGNVNGDGDCPRYCMVEIKIGGLRMEGENCRECAFGFKNEENLLAKKHRGMVFCKWLTVNRDILPTPIYKGYRLDVRPLVIDWISPCQASPYCGQ